MKSEMRLTLALCLAAAAWAVSQSALAQDEGVGMPPPGAPMRPWGPEQATGEPDTFEAGDIQTAWASLHPDGGREWLRVNYPRAVQIAEVRIRETFNPGAVIKVAAVLKGGEEAPLWEGRDPTTEAPADLVVKPPKGKAIEAKSVRIYLDTRLVPGWNEIDAIELVGKDGTRQWAVAVSASSSFAVRPRGPAPPPPAPRPDPFRELRDRPVKVLLDGGKALDGVFVRNAGDFVLIRQPKARKILFINKSKIVVIEGTEPLGPAAF